MLEAGDQLRPHLDPKIMKKKEILAEMLAWSKPYEDEHLIIVNKTGRLKTHANQPV